MNKERLLKIIQDMEEVKKNLNECKDVLQIEKKSKTTIFIEFGLKQIFVDFFIIVENFTSMVLKELREFKIGIDMKQSLDILYKNDIVEEDLFIFLNEARLLRNRISHRYKEPSTEELLIFITDNINNFNKITEIMRKFL